jgi:hypothetical protein
MGLGDLYQNDVETGLGAMARRPVEAPREERSAWGAPWRAVKSAAAEVVGSTADVLGAYGQVMAGTDAPAGSPEHQKLRAGVDLSSETGDLFRGVSRDLRPDPATASTAEQVVYGVVRPLAKLVGGGALMGPFGLGFAAGEEGFTQADELRQQGVDQGTRSAVGALTAATTFGTAFLPLAGSTLKATAGLYLLGGPGGFMAQQYATRKILEAADYDRIAQQYDPLDPMGLAISALLPLPFAAHGALRVVRGRAAEAPPVRVEPTIEPAPAEPVAAAHAEPAFPDTQPAVHVPEEVVDAAMVHNLTRLQDAQDAVVREGGPAEVMREQVRALEGERAAWLSDPVEAARVGSVLDDRAAVQAVEPPTARQVADRVAEIDQRLASMRSELERITGVRQPEAAPAQEGAPAPRQQPAQEPAKGDGAAPALGTEQLTQTPAAALKDRTPEHLATVTERAAQIEAEKPDTVVRHTEDGKPVTAADEMARIRQEITEGTDGELGTLDAELVRVAAACALATGA